MDEVGRVFLGNKVGILGKRGEQDRWGKAGGTESDIGMDCGVDGGGQVSIELQKDVFRSEVSVHNFAYM